MTEYERVREQTLLTDEEIEQAFHDAPLEDYKVGDSLRNICQAQLDKALKTDGIEIRADDQSLPTYRGKPLIEGSNAIFLIKALKLAGFIKVAPKGIK